MPGPQSVEGRTRGHRPPGRDLGDDMAEAAAILCARGLALEGLRVAREGAALGISWILARSSASP